MDRWHTGRLLVATPALDDPNFERVVILVLDHDEDGALGVVLNRASGVPVRETLDGWVELAAGPPPNTTGGSAASSTQPSRVSRTGTPEARFSTTPNAPSSS